MTTTTAGERSAKWEKTAENTKLELARTRTHLIKVKALVSLYLPFLSLSLTIFLLWFFVFRYSFSLFFIYSFRFCFSATRQGIPQSKDNNVQFICVPFFKSQAKAESSEISCSQTTHPFFHALILSRGNAGHEWVKNRVGDEQCSFYINWGWFYGKLSESFLLWRGLQSSLSVLWQSVET